MAINEHWNIRSRAHACFHTAQPFADGESFMTVLLEDPKTGDLQRRDYSLEAWTEVEPTLGSSFSVWRSEYEAVKSESRPEITEKESAETLLRRLCEEDSIMTENTRYILAVMLERKKQLKQTGTRETEEATFLVYEHIKSGEVYIIRDPELKLAQIEEVQKEVSRLLTGGGEAAGPALAAGPVPSSDESGEAPAVAVAEETAGMAPQGEAETMESEPESEVEAEVESDPADDAVGEAERSADDAGWDDVVVDEVPAREVSGEGLTSEEMAEREQ